MARNTVGLDVGSTAVRAVEIRAGRKPQIVRFGRVQLPEGAIDHGEVRDVNAVSGAITELWKRLGITDRNVHLGISSRGVVVRVVDLPAMEGTDLDDAMRFQAQDHIPIPLHEAVMDYQVLSETTDENGASTGMRVLIAAAGRSTVDPLIEAVRKARLTPLSLELNAYPLVRVLGTDAGAEAIVDVGASVTTIVIHEAGRVQLARILGNVGGEDFTQALVDEDSDDHERAEQRKRTLTDYHLASVDELDPEPDDDGLHLPAAAHPTHGPRAAFSLRESIGLADGDEDESHDPADPVMAPAKADPLVAAVDRLVTEVKGSIDFYTSKDESLERVILTGGGALLAGLDKALSEALSVPVKIGHAFERVPVASRRIGGTERSAAEPFLSVAVGLALAGAA